MDLLLGKTSKAAVNTKGQGGRTLLSWAAMNGHGAVVKLLVAQDDIDVESKDEDGHQTPLSLAASGGHAAIIELLLPKADINSRDYQGQSPLSLAAIGGHKTVVELLLPKTDINSKDVDGCMSMFSATMYRREAVVTLLIEAGANVEGERHWKRLQSLTAKSTNEALARLLSERQPNCSTSKAETNDDVAIPPP